MQVNNQMAGNAGAEESFRSKNASDLYNGEETKEIKKSSIKTNPDTFAVSETSSVSTHVFIYLGSLVRYIGGFAIPKGSNQDQLGKVPSRNSNVECEWFDSP
jgi:hypothetical protein